MLEAYRADAAERAALGILPLPLSKQQTTELVSLLGNPPKGEEAFLLGLITNRVPAGVDDAAKVKADYLARVAKGEEASPLISKVRATELLGDAGRLQLLQRREGPRGLRQAGQRQRKGRGRREAPFAGCRRQDRRGLHRQLHDEYRPFPGPGKSAASKDRHRDDAPLDRPADENGRGSSYQGGLLRRIRCPLEMPGCSLCMGNQAQIKKGSTAMSTSTRNFPNRLGIDTRVYLGSAELAAVCALLGRIPTVAEYIQHIEAVNKNADDVYRTMSFDQIEEYNNAGTKAAA